MKKFLPRKIEIESADFFHADQKRKKNADLFAGFLRVPTWRIKRKSTLTQPNRSAEFFCANLRKPFFLRRSIKKKNADGSIRRRGLGLIFFDLYSLGLPTFGR